MPTLADLVASYTRTPSAACYLDGKRWYGVQKLSFHQKFKEQVATGTAEGRNPPLSPQIGMPIRWEWGYNGVHVAGFTGEVSSYSDSSYPDRVSIQCSDVLWRAEQSSQVLQTSPLNDILASDAVRYLLTHYGGISSSRLSIPALPASGSAWVGGEWTLGILTPVQWGDSDTESGGTTALRAAAEICACLGFWLYADSGGTIRAKQMEKKPSTVAREVFRRAINLLIQGAPERQQSFENVFNQVTVRGANTGVDGAQLWDQRRTSSSLLPSGVYRDFPFSSFLLEYENASDAGAASVSSVAARILNVVSRVPDVVPLRAKADPNRKVGDTVGIIDTGIAIPTQRNFFLYEITRSLDLATGAFDDQLLLDGGTGSSGYTTVPPPDASFSWTLLAETLDGTAVIEVALDGSGSTSPTGEIVSWTWSTSTPTYASTPDTATGVNATLIFALADSPAVITLTVLDTTSKTSSFESTIDLSGAGLAPPLSEVVSAACGSAWVVTPDGGATWNVETSNGDAIAVGTIGAGYDDRAAGTAGTYGLVATRGTGGVGLRQTLDALASPSTNLVSAGGAITSNIWVNESNPARVWFAVGTAVYRSLDGGLTKTAMHVAPATVHWMMEDPAVENSVFLLAGANMYNATDPTVGWAVLYSGPLGATARQFVRSRDGQVTWICYTGAPAGEALQRIENGAAADIAVTDVQSLALSRDASSALATLYAVTADDPAELWSFDGLTGLSAVLSSQTFPAGATVQHMLSSRQFDVIYTADFDSIATGQGALRKYFPLPDQLLLWKELAAGQQGHMLGFGGPPRGVAQILLGTWGTATGGGGIWWYDNGWTLTQPGPTDWRWLWVSANPFNASEWLALGNSGSGTATAFSVDGAGKIVANGTSTSPLWYTDDSGATWSEIVLTHPAVTSVDGSGVTSAARASRCSWQTAQSGWLFSIRSDDGITGYDRRTSWWRGAGTTITDGPHTNALIAGFGWQADAHAPGRDNDLILMKTFQGAAQFYVAGDATVETLIGSATAAIPYSADYEAGALAANLAVVGGDGHLWYTSDYRTTLISNTGLTGLVSITGTAVSWVATQTGPGLYQYALTPTSATIIGGTEADTFGQVRADRQTRTIVASRTPTAVVLYDTATGDLGRVLLPVGASELSVTAIEPIVGT